MRKSYPLTDSDFDFSHYIFHHSGDRTLPYKHIDGQDIYVSYFHPTTKNTTPRPTIILIHGGGWSAHKIFPDQNGLWQGDYLGYLARYFAEQGFICVSVDYRLSREEGQEEHYQLIDCFDDCTCAVDYILDHAQEHGIDPTRVYLLGESAGGHLAGLLATTYVRPNFHFQSAFLVNGVLNIADCPTWHKLIPRHSSHPALKDLTLQERGKYLSPRYRLDCHTCPIILIHGSNDTTVDVSHSQSFYEGMCSLGLPCDLHIIEKTRHAFLLAEYTDNLPATKIAIAILDAYLKNA